MSTQPKFEPGQRVKVTGNKDALGFTYHRFRIYDHVEIVRHRPERGDAYLCKNDTGMEQTLYANDLQPLNHD